VREGVELAARMFQPQLPQIEGITEDEIKLLKVCFISKTEYF
jgi:hypothetical protein